MSAPLGLAKIAPAERRAFLVLSFEERDGLRRLIDQHRRAKLGFDDGATPVEAIQARVRDLLGEGPQTCQQLTAATGLNRRKVQGALRVLAASGQIEPAGRFKGQGGMSSYIWHVTGARKAWSG